MLKMVGGNQKTREAIGVEQDKPKESSYTVDRRWRPSRSCWMALFSPLKEKQEHPYLGGGRSGQDGLL